MKITIVAFDLWGFNKKIADCLAQKGISVTFIDSNKIHFFYKNKSQRVKNFFSKTFLNKNIKKDYRKNTILNIIRELPLQDIILIVNPDHFHIKIVNELKTKTKKYIACNYDSLKRNPSPKNFDILFDKIYSFDILDVQQHSYLNLLNNFIYIDKDFYTKPNNKMFMILSKSMERELILSKIADFLDAKGISNYEFIVSQPALAHKKFNKKILLTNQNIALAEVIQKSKNAEILIDLIRPNQSGLSFRFFEAMALHKKVITNNKTIAEYDFYNPNNIVIIDENIQDIPDSFLNTPYEEV